MGLLGGAVFVRPLVAIAQESPIIGYLNSGAGIVRPTFYAGLKEAGFIEGKNVILDYRSAGGRYDQLPALAADLVSRQVAVIVADGSIGSALAAKSSTSTIPIVFLIGADPVRSGLVESLNRPGGNLTGITTLTGIIRKQLKMLLQLVPNAKTFAMLVNPANPTHTVDKAGWRHIAEDVGVTIETASARDATEFEPVIASLASKQIDAVYVVADSLFGGGDNRSALIAMFARYRMPAMFSNGENVLDGGLISYGGSRREAERQLGIYTGLVLKGAKPADLPVFQVTKVKLSINLKTAKALGIVVPSELLTLADEIIE